MPSKNLSIKELKHYILPLIMLTMLLLPFTVYAQQSTQLSVPGCGFVSISIVNPSTMQQQQYFTEGQVVAVELLPAPTSTPCTATVTITLTSPQGVPSTPVNTVESLSPSTPNVIPVMNPVSSQTPTGQWTAVVNINGISTTLEFSVGTPPSPPPPPPTIPSWLLAVIVIIVVVIIAFAFVMYRQRSARPSAAPATAGPTPAPVSGGTVVKPESGATIVKPRSEGTKVYAALYKLVLPDGREIPISDGNRIFGRETFERWGISREVLDYISREERGGHFRIFTRGGKWYVEDLNSTNGTLLNGVEIRGKGPQELKDGDVISPAGALNLRFRLSS